MQYPHRFCRTNTPKTHEKNTQTDHQSPPSAGREDRWGNAKDPSGLRRLVTTKKLPKSWLGRLYPEGSDAQKDG